MSFTSPWTDERVDALTRLWRHGQSASAIARALGGVTRNAVIGKVHRLGLSGRATPAAPGSRAARPRRPRRLPQDRRLALPPAPLRVVAATPLVAELPLDGLTDVVAVGRHACRWPIGDPKDARFALCGRAAVRGAYCAAHGARAYRPTPRDHLLKLAGLA